MSSISALDKKKTPEPVFHLWTDCKHLHWQLQDESLTEPFNAGFLHCYQLDKLQTDAPSLLPRHHSATGSFYKVQEEPDGAFKSKPISDDQIFLMLH